MEKQELIRRGRLLSKRVAETEEEVSILQNQSSASMDLRLKNAWLEFAVAEQQRLLEEQEQTIAEIERYFKEHNIALPKDEEEFSVS